MLTHLMKDKKKIPGLFVSKFTIVPFEEKVNFLFIKQSAKNSTLNCLRTFYFKSSKK